jgi:hypothetical protein
MRFSSVIASRSDDSGSVRISRRSAVPISSLDSFRMNRVSMTSVLGPMVFDLIQGLFQTESPLESNVLCGHDAAGGVCPIAQEVLDFLGVAGFHQTQQFFSQGQGEFPQHVCDVVYGHVGEDPNDPLRLKKFEDAVLEVLVPFFQNGGDLLIHCQEAKAGQFLVLKVFQSLCDVDGVVFFKQFCEYGNIPAVQGVHQEFVQVGFHRRTSLFLFFEVWMVKMWFFDLLSL